MKKFCLIFVCLLSFVGVDAQLVGSEQNVESKGEELSAGKVSEGHVYYAGKFESAANLGLNFRFSYFEFGGAMQVSGPGSAWNINAGTAYRYYLGKSLFIEGAGGLFYSHASSEARVANGTYTKKVGSLGYREFTNYEDVKTSMSAVGLYVTPRVGIVVSKGWGIYGAYQLDFAKFKFDNIGDRGYWKLGLIIPF